MKEKSFDEQLAALGHAIQRERAAQGLTVRRLADMTGIDHSNISRIEAGKEHNPGFRRLLKIACALDVEFKDLL